MSRILLVEDDHSVRVLLEHVLIDAGYEVDSTATAAEARSLLDSVSYELLLADGRFPAGAHAHSAGVEVFIRNGELLLAAALIAPPEDETPEQP